MTEIASVGQFTWGLRLLNDKFYFYLLKLVFSAPLNQLFTAADMKTIPGWVNSVINQQPEKDLILGLSALKEAIAGKAFDLLLRIVLTFFFWRIQAFPREKHEFHNRLDLN